MAHPQMFDEDDPWLARVANLALAFPGADRKVSHGRPAFFTRKVFAYYGGTRKRSEGGHEPHDHALIVMVDATEREALDADTRFFAPAYLGPSGWRGLDLDTDTDWGEIVELLDASYRATAPRSFIADLDART